MNREIKFNFIYGIDGKVETYFNKTFTLGEIENAQHINEICDTPTLKEYSILAKRESVGMNDVDGREAYEGDIIERSSPTGKGKIRGVIQFKDCCFIVRWVKFIDGGWNEVLKYHLPESKVIGNNIQHLELLS